jgi:GTPase SAR1 family protein
MDIFDRQVAAYDSWKQNLIRQILQFHNWSKTYNLNYEEGSARIHRALKLLQGDNITLAFVGEFSRGKTELINALFYNELGFRLLPSQPGRTTMCPTELFYDARLRDNAVRLLPIETRRSTASLDSFKKIPNKWITLKFDPRNEEEIARVMAEVAKSKVVSRAEAEALGFESANLQASAREEGVIIPAWRHAMINIDHQLLRKGLRIIDTPGLNALGSEPELTLSTLPGANAVIFMLSADAGVTASDYSIWENHLRHLIKNKAATIYAVLNKIDVMWDDLKTESEIADAIDEVRWQTAKQLKLKSEQVLTLSAKQGLLAKAKDDAILMMKSKLVDLETLLSKRVLYQQEDLIENTVIADVLAMMDDSYNLVKEKIFEFDTQISSIKFIHTDIRKQEQEMDALRTKVKRAHSEYQKQVIGLKSSRKLMQKEAKALRQSIHSNKINAQVEQTQKELHDSWTTLGLGKAMDQFFLRVDENIALLDQEMLAANNLLKSVYGKYEDNKTIVMSLNRNLLDIQSEKFRINQLRQHAQHLKADFKTLLSDKKSVIELFYNTVVSKTLEIYGNIEEKIVIWEEEALVPLFQYCIYQKQLLEQQITQLTAKESKVKTSAEHLRSLQANVEQLDRARAAIEKLIQEINPLTVPEGNANNVVHLLRRVR